MKKNQKEIFMSRFISTTRVN